MQKNSSKKFALTLLQAIGTIFKSFLLVGLLGGIAAMMIGSFIILKTIETNLTQEEKEIVRRGRNTQTHHIAKNASMQDYMYATALEALIGYLYLTGQKRRLEQVLFQIVENRNEI